MTSIIAVLDFFVTSFVSVISEFVNLIVGDPLLLFFVVLSFVGLGLGLIRRIIS